MPVGAAAPCASVAACAPEARASPLSRVLKAEGAAMPAMAVSPAIFKKSLLLLSMLHRLLRLEMTIPTIRFHGGVDVAGVTEFFFVALTFHPAILQAPYILGAVGG